MVYLLCLFYQSKIFFSCLLFLIVCHLRNKTRQICRYQNLTIRVFPNRRFLSSYEKYHTKNQHTKNENSSFYSSTAKIKLSWQNLEKWKQKAGYLNYSQQSAIKEILNCCSMLAFTRNLL